MENTTMTTYFIANVLYNMTVDMDYADYSDSYYRDIAALARDLEKLGPVSLAALERLAINNMELYDEFRPID